MEKLGIKETKEAMEAGLEVGVFLTGQLSDGLQVFEDFEAFYKKFTTDEVFKAKVKAGWDNAKAIPAEVKDLDFAEGVDLALTAGSYAPRFVEALKPKPKDESGA